MGSTDWCGIIGCNMSVMRELIGIKCVRRWGGAGWFDNRLQWGRGGL